MHVDFQRTNRTPQEQIAFLADLIEKIKTGDVTLLSINYEHDFRY